MKNQKVQFSKTIIAGVMFTYFISVIVTCIVVLVKDCSQVSVLCTFVGTQTTSALGFYLWKAKNENMLKIKKGSDKNGCNEDYRINNNYSNDDM